MLTASKHAVFQSHHEVMDALTQNYAGDHDAQRAINVDKMHKNTASACQRQEEAVRATIFSKPAGTAKGFEPDLDRLLFCRVDAAGAKDTGGSNSQGESGKS